MDNKTSKMKNFIVGIFVGIASMLPGVSGAVVAVCFGIYERLIKDVSDLLHRGREDYMFLLVIGLGLIVGIIVVSFGLDFMLDNIKVISYFFFIGLIMGQIPELNKLTRDECRPATKHNLAALIVGIAIMVVLILLGTGEEKVLEHNIVSYISMVLVGLILAITKIAPGISGSTFLLAFGLLGAVTTAITDFDLVLLLPILVGLVIGLLGFSKIINYALDNHKRSTYFIILGLTVGSLLLISMDTYNIYNDIGNFTDIVFGIVALILGIVVSFLFICYGKKDCKNKVCT